MKFTSFTNVRPIRNSVEEIVAMPPTNSGGASGSFKLSNKAVEKLKGTKGDYIDLIKNSEGQWFVGLGDNGDESNGNEGSKGSKLGKSGSSYNASAAAAWVNLGSETEKVHYSLGEGIEAELEYGTRTIFPLVESKRVAHTPKKTGGAKKSEEVSGARPSIPAETVNEEPQVEAEESDEFAEL